MAVTYLDTPNWVVQYGGTSVSSTFYCYGWITSSATELHVIIYMHQLLERARSVTLTAMTLSGRLAPSGGYVGGGENYNAYSNAKTRTATVVGRAIRFVLTKSSGTWGTNNTTFAGTCTISITIGW